MPRELSPWCKRAKIAMIRKGITGVELARELGYSRSYVTSVLNGRANVHLRLSGSVITSIFRIRTKRRLMILGFKKKN